MQIQPLLKEPVELPRRVAVLFHKVDGALDFHSLVQVIVQREEGVRDELHDLGVDGEISVQIQSGQDLIHGADVPISNCLGCRKTRTRPVFLGMMK